jgi:prevent-host-death family protein
MSRSPAKAHKAIKATEAKNRFGLILKAVTKAQPVFIEKHGEVCAVLIDIDSYNALTRRSRSREETQLDELREEFDTLYARMQTARARKAMDALFAASPERLAEVAAKRLVRRG